MIDFLETCSAEFEGEIVQLVEQEFEARCKLPGNVAKVPWIDGEFDPHASPEELAELKQSVIRALSAREWFRDEAPKFCQPLPLCEAERVLLNGSSDRRLWEVARYAGMLQSMDWHFELAMPFFDYIQQTAPR